MWLRNLVFIGLIVVGGGALAGSLFPPTAPPRAEHFDSSQVNDPAFRQVVEAVNASVRQKWLEQSLEPAPKATELAVARRLSLALTGTIPSLQEIRQFEAYQSPERLQWWLAGILQDRRHSDYLAERLARVYVGTEDGPFLIYRRRRFVTWLSDEFMQNRPYDQLVRELIAADGLWTDKPATNFITVTFDGTKKDRPNPERLAGRIARAFLGIRLDCAQCHNHPFQDWKRLDFQGLAAFFGQTQQGFTGIHDGKGEYRLENKKTLEKEVIDPRVPFAAELLPRQGTRRQRLAQWVTDPKNPYFAKAAVNRTWALLFGRPLVEPVDDIAADDKPPPRALQLLADDFVAHGYDLQRLVKLIVATEVFQLDSAAPHLDGADPQLLQTYDRNRAIFPLTQLRPEQVVGGILQAASLETINHESHIIVKLASYFGQKDFVKRYGDTGEDDFGNGSTIPQMLLLMNGKLVKEKTKDSLFNAATRIAFLAPDDRSAIESAYLAVLTRRPTPEETAHFQDKLTKKRWKRNQLLEDIYWVLLNVTEFSWNH